MKKLSLILALAIVLALCGCLQTEYNWHISEYSTNEEFANAANEYAKTINDNDLIVVSVDFKDGSKLSCSKYEFEYSTCYARTPIFDIKIPGSDAYSTYMGSGGIFTIDTEFTEDGKSYPCRIIIQSTAVDKKDIAFDSLIKEYHFIRAMSDYTAFDGFLHSLCYLYNADILSPEGRFFAWLRIEILSEVEISEEIRDEFCNEIMDNLVVIEVEK